MGSGGQGGRLRVGGAALAVDQLLFSMAEAAAILGIEGATLRDLVNDGAIQYVQLRYDRGDYRFSREDLEGFVSGLPRRRKGAKQDHQPVTNPDQARPHLVPSSLTTTIEPVPFTPRSGPISGRSG